VSIVSVSLLLVGERSASHPVALRGRQTITLGQLRAETAHNAKLIAGCGARRALLVCEDSYWFVVGLLALTHIGVEIVLPPNTQSGTLRMIGECFDLLVTDIDRPEIERRFILEPSDDHVSPMTVDVGRSRVDFFTSGSTGQMKRVEKTVALLEREAAVLESVWGERLGDARVFGTVSHQHIFGLTFKLLWPLLAGRCFSTTTHGAWEALLVDLTSGAAIISSPAHLTRLGGLQPLPGSMRPALIFTAGAPLPVEAAAETEEVFGIAPIEIFGSTETGAVAWREISTEASPWQPLPGIAITSHGEGLLRIRSPFVAGDGWCDLADRVALMADGRFCFEGRADKIVKIEGKRVSMQQLEHDLVKLPWIDAAAVAPVTTTRTFLGAVVVLSEAGRAQLASLGKFRFERMLRRDLATTHDAAVLPRRWRFVDRLPMDGMGKRRMSDVSALLETPR
jgi:acyl-coenzyme A synthetase/AMP-(fatty) acid ligase